MSTHSTIKFINIYNGEKTQYVNIYQQCDGYVDGVGHQLANWLIKKHMVNGFRLGDNSDCANGIGCLVAQFIRDFKTDIGGLYITNPDDWQEYNYEVIIDCTKTGWLNNITTIKATYYDEQTPFFEGSPSELLEFEEE